MPTTYGILYDKDRRVRIFNDGTPVVASLLQSQYAKYINFIGSRFTTVANGDKYDVSLTYPDKIIPYEEGVAKGVTPGWLNFNGTHFDVSSIASDMYTISNPAYGKAIANDSVAPNAFTTPRKLNFIGADVTEDVPNDEFDITVTDDKTAIFNNSVQVGTVGRRLNFLGPGHSIVEDVTNNQFDIDLAYLPNPFGPYKWGLAYGSQGSLTGSFGDGLFSTGYTQDQGDVTGINSTTHGHARRYITSGADNDEIEVFIPNLTRLRYNPHLYIKMSLAVMDDSRFFLGFNTSSIPSGSNTYLNNLSGFGLSYQYDVADVEDTVLNVNRNGGDATEDKVSLGQSLTSTTPFTVELIGDTANNRWGWNYNGGAFTYYTTHIPTTDIDLGFTFRMEQIASGPATIDFWYIYLTQSM